MERNIKKLIILASVVVTVMLCFAFSASALDETGQCGKNVYWKYDSSTKELIISGKGAMYDYFTDDMRYYNINRDSDSPFFDSDIVSLVIEDGVTTIGAWAFDDCASLTEVTISDSVTSIGNVAFDHCKSLKEIKFSNGLKYIGEKAFFYCTSIENIIIPDSVIRIGYNAFGGCKSVKSITLPFVGGMRTQERSFDHLGLNVYPNASKLEVILSDACTEIPDGAFDRNKKINSVTLGKNVTSIGDMAFFYCENLTDITIKGNVKTVGIDAFHGCAPYVNVYAKDLSSWLGIEFAEISSFLKYYNLYFGNKLVTNLTIPEGVTAIKPYAFYGADSLKSVVIPDSVTSMGENSFSLCRNLEDVTIGYGVNTIKKYTFKDSGLVTLRIPATVTKIETEAFNCVPGPVFRQVYYTGTEKQWNAINIGECNNFLKNATIKFNVPQSITGRTSKITAIQNTSAVKLTWSAVKGANIYRVYQKNGSKWKALGNVAKLDGTIKNLKAGTKYTFAVKAGVKNGSNVAWSNAYKTIDTATKPATVTAKASSPSKGKINLSWNSVSGSEGYQVWYKNGNGSYKLYKTVGAGVRSMSFSNLKSGRKYTFAVRAGIKTSGGNIFGGYKTATVTVK
ncbi:MAG: leucine-rich repeat protein [Acutalibacteraceae bacterium]